MGKLIVDQIQKPGGSTFTLPTTASAGVLNSDSSGNLSIGALKFAPIEGNTIGMIVSSTAQANTYGSPAWTSDGPGGQTFSARYVGNIASDSYSTYQGWNMLMGDGQPNGTSERMFVYNRNGDILRQPYYANKQRLGHYRHNQYYDNNTTDDYTGITFSVLPVRNITGTSVTKTFQFYHSSDMSSYGGTGLAIYTPTAGLYSAVTSGTWTQGYTQTSSTNITGGSASVVIPANTTVLLFLATSHNYQTTYRFSDTHFYYNIDTAVDGTSVICDLRMLETLRTNRNSGNTAYNILGMPNYYTQCATQYGDR
jgi:hypothetical protein